MPAAECADQQMRDNLDRTMTDLERLKSGNNYDQDGQRRQLIGQLAQSNCGPQYRAAAAAAGPAGFLDSLFGGHIINPGGDGAPTGTFRTVCVRACDGYYFPISYSTVQSRFADDARTCQRECPATAAELYTYRNPGEDIGQAVSLGGQSYSALPTAFQYRKEFSAACSCRRPGQSWADALKGADDFIDARERRHRRDRPEFQSPVAAAAAERRQARQAHDGKCGAGCRRNARFDGHDRHSRCAQNRRAQRRPALRRRTLASPSFQGRASARSPE